MDIGCYPISLSRFLFNAEPKKVYANIEVHPEFKTDTLATAILEFELPFNPIADKPATIWLCQEDQKEAIIFDSCDQYTIQGDLFSLAIINGTPVPAPLQDAVDNMIVIEKLFSADLARSH